MPETKKISALATIAQKYTFWPALKKSTYSGSSTSVFETYSLTRLIHCRSFRVHVIGSHQLGVCSPKAAPNPRPNHRCRNLVAVPPAKNRVQGGKRHRLVDGSPQR